MNNVNSEQLISWSKIIMILSGLWNLPVSKNRLVQHVYSGYSIFMKSSLFACWLCMAAECIRLATNGYSIALITTSLSVTINTTKVATKVVIYIKNDVLDMFKDVIEREREVWASSEEIKKVYNAKIRICRFYVVVIGTITYFAIGFLQVFGAIATVQLKRYNEANNETLEPHFMFLTIFPRDKLANMKLEFATQILWTWVGLFHCATHITFLTLLVYSVSRLEILQVRLRTYIEPEFRDDPSEEEVKGKVMVLKSLIREHKYIIRFIEHLNECTKYIVMMEFVLGAFDISSITANIIKIDLSQIAWQLSFFALLASEIFILAWSCNEIKVQSEAIADALYESRWYLLNKEAKQLTMIMIARAQKPLSMTIGPFGPMTTNSAVMVMKAAYSYVSIMRE